MNVTISFHYHDNMNMETGLPPTFGQIPPTSGHSDWPTWDIQLPDFVGKPLPIPIIIVSKDITGNQASMYGISHLLKELFN